jgi:LytS/YehU family sensor histidine kinase
MKVTLHFVLITFLSALSLLFTQMVQGPGILPNGYFREYFGVGLTFNIFIFYSLYYLLSLRKLKAYWWGRPVVILVLLGLSVGISTGIDIEHINTSMNSASKGHLTYFLIVNTAVKFVFIGCALMAKIIINLTEKKQKYSLLKLATLQAELALLKNQTNPHFLFNTLNALYSSSYQYGDIKTATGIGQISGLMRYMLHKNSREQVPLSGEIEHIEDFIALQQFRYQSKLRVKLTLPQDNLDCDIPPMLLMPLIENAFKYGIISNQDNELSLSLNIENNKMIFEVINNDYSHLIKNTGDFKQSGTGINNLKKRLDAIFDNNYQLECSSKNTQYRAYLVIPC